MCNFWRASARSSRWSDPKIHGLQWILPPSGSRSKAWGHTMHRWRFLCNALAGVFLWPMRRGIFLLVPLVISDGIGLSKTIPRQFNILIENVRLVLFFDCNATRIERQKYENAWNRKQSIIYQMIKETTLKSQSRSQSWSWVFNIQYWILSIKYHV